MKTIHLLILAILAMCGMAYAAICLSCNGTGTGSQPCFTCRGQGIVNGFRCFNCDGRRFQRCIACNGRGQR